MKRSRLYKDNLPPPLAPFPTFDYKFQASSPSTFPDVDRSEAQTALSILDK